MAVAEMVDGSIYRIKSNALDGQAVGQGDAFGWANFSGKATYLEPGMIEPDGNCSFLVYVEDRNEPGNGVDQFWLQVRGKDDEVIAAMSMPEPATSNTRPLEGGNVVVPHTPASLEQMAGV